MKLIHCADLHLDSRLDRHYNRANGNAEKAAVRRAALLNNFYRLVDYAQQNSVRAILISGDLFDTRKAHAATVKAVLQKILDAPSLDFFYLRGNHDNENAFGDALPGNLHMFSSEWTRYECEDVTITGAELSEENNETLHGNIPDFPEEKINIVMLHGQDTDALRVGKGDFIRIPLFRHHKIDYLALGHIHSYVREKLDARGIYCYPGCLEGRGFDETGEHGFVLLTVTDGKIEDEFVPFAGFHVLEIPVDISGCENSGEVLNAIRCQIPKDPDRVMAKIILRGEISEEAAIELPFLLSAVRDEFYFAELASETKIRVDYRKYENEESLRGAFIRNVRKDETLSEDEKGEVIATGLKILTEGGR